MVHCLAILYIILQLSQFLLKCLLFVQHAHISLQCSISILCSHEWIIILLVYILTLNLASQVIYAYRKSRLGEGALHIQRLELFTRLLLFRLNRISSHLWLFTQLICIKESLVLNDIRVSLASKVPSLSHEHLPYPDVPTTHIIASESFLLLLGFFRAIFRGWH